MNQTLSQQEQISNEEALQPPLTITNPGSEYAAEARQFQGIPGIEREAGGRLWATWYSGGQGEGSDNYALLASSADDGQSWSAPLLAIDSPGSVRVFDPALWIDPLQRLWLFWAQSYGLKDGRFGVWAMRQESSDASTPSWSPPRRLCDGIMMNKPTVLTSGEWVLPVAVWKEEPQYPTHPAVPPEARTPHVVVSEDEGQTWTRRGGVEMENRCCDEHMIIERRDGSLWMLIRLQEGIGESTSHDKGFTWTPGRKTAIAHRNSRFYIRRLLSGNLLLVKHPEFDNRCRLTAYLSEDDGKTWQGGLLLDERANTYPDGTQADDGRIYVVYDHGRREEKEILMAVFTEEDILAREAVSPQARLKVLVDKAGEGDASQ